MTVPPVQTDVNIGMVSTGETETPTYQLAAEEVLPLVKKGKAVYSQLCLSICFWP